MDFVMNWMIVLLMFGTIVMCLGMFWAMIDGRLWNNPGEALMHWGMGICVVAGLVMLVTFFNFAVQCALANGICPT